MAQFKKSLEQIELETLEDASTRTTSSRAHVQREIENQVQEFLRNGGKIQEVCGHAAASGNFNSPITERSSRIAERFVKRENKPPHNKGKKRSLHAVT